MSQKAERRRRVPPKRTNSAAPDLAAVSSAAPSPAIASVLVVVVFAGYLLMQLVNVLDSAPGGAELLTCVGVPPALAALQYIHSAPHMTATRARLLPWSLVLQTALTFAPLIAFGWHWGGMAGFLAGSLLLLLPRTTGWVLFGLTTAAVVVISSFQSLGVVNVAYMGVSTALTGLVLFAVARLAALATAIHASRDELARMAVARERLRFARDLHDLLGYSLSSITLKNELIARLIDGNPQRAREEVAEVLTIARQALADVREVARGYRDMSLLVEAESARSVLKAAGIDARIDVSVTGLSSTANTILATVLREGVTNMLRHSQSSTCSITTSLDEEEEFVELEMVNDGVGNGSSLPKSAVPNGTGLGNLAARVATVGGGLRVGADRDDEAGVFRLVVRVPTDAAPVADAAESRDASPRLTV
ncbi:two-component system sensor histidine kinase DesK [Streptomyces sp. SAI-195]|uniref:sensor histidine kinase n=1 Tax=unclassified Streptomyces TaxID=2593676 RepID=UPI000F4BB308